MAAAFPTARAHARKVQDDPDAYDPHRWIMTVAAVDASGRVIKSHTTPIGDVSTAAEDIFAYILYTQDDLEQRLNEISRLLDKGDSVSLEAARTLADFQSANGKASGKARRDTKWREHVRTVRADLRKANHAAAKDAFAAKLERSLDDNGIKHPHRDQIARYERSLKRDDTSTK
jgi:hypothetical protein